MTKAHNHTSLPPLQSFQAVRNGVLRPVNIRGRSNALGQLVADVPNALMVRGSWSHVKQRNTIGYTISVVILREENVVDEEGGNEMDVRCNKCLVR